MGYTGLAHRGIATPAPDRFNSPAMAAVKSLDSFTVPLGAQAVELQEIVHAEGGMALLRVRIREGKRFTVFDIDPATARRWAEAMKAWALRQPG